MPLLELFAAEVGFSRAGRDNGRGEYATDIKELLVVCQPRMATSAMGCLPRASSRSRGPDVAAIRRQRELMGDTQRHLLTKSELTVGALAKIERGEANPTWTTPPQEYRQRPRSEACGADRDGRTARALSRQAVVSHLAVKCRIEIGSRSESSPVLARRWAVGRWRWVLRRRRCVQLVFERLERGG